MGTMVRWGVWGGLALGLVIAALHSVLPPLFTPDPAVQEALGAALVVVGLGQAVAGYVFVLDGVLIGAGDGRWLAWGMVVTLVAYLPVILAVRSAGPSGSATRDVVVLWVAFTAFMAIRGSCSAGGHDATTGWSSAPVEGPQCSPLAASSRRRSRSSTASERTGHT